MPELTILLSRPRDSWRWIRWDVPLRLFPLLAVPLGFVWLGRQPAALGLVAPHALRDVLLGVVLGVPAYGLAAAAGEWLLRRASYRVVPDLADLGLQTAYYAVLNAPVEELFFRGLLQNGLALTWGAPTAAFVIATAIFTLYHRLGRWSWEATAMAGVAGLVLGMLFLLQNPPSLVLPVTVHAFITCGFLGPGPWLWWRLGLGRLSPPVEQTRTAR